MDSYHAWSWSIRSFQFWPFGKSVILSEIIGHYARNPLPTYGSDTVLHCPPRPGQDDEELRHALQVKVGDIYESADHIEGEPRYDDLAEKLAALEE